MAQTKGEARRMTYRPGERIPESLPVEDGTYNLSLSKYEQGERGWKAKPGKFPSKKVTFSILDTEDEVTGSEKTVTEYLSLSPKITFRLMFLAQAAGYPEEFDLPKYGDKEFTSPKVRECAHIADAILDYMKDNGAVLRANLSSEEFNGRTSNRVAKWLPPEDMAQEAEAPAAEEAPSDEPTSAFGGEGEESEPEQAAEEEADAVPEPEPSAPKRPSKVQVSAKVLPLGQKKAAAVGKKPGRK